MIFIEVQSNATDRIVSVNPDKIISIEDESIGGSRIYFGANNSLKVKETRIEVLSKIPYITEKPL